MLMRSPAHWPHLTGTDRDTVWTRSMKKMMVEIVQQVRCFGGVKWRSCGVPSWYPCGRRAWRS